MEGDGGVDMSCEWHPNEKFGVLLKCQNNCGKSQILKSRLEEVETFTCRVTFSVSRVECEGTKG